MAGQTDAHARVQQLPPAHSQRHHLPQDPVQEAS